MSEKISVENYSAIVTEAIQEVVANPEKRVDEISEEVVNNAIEKLGLEISEDEKHILIFQVTYSVVGS